MRPARFLPRGVSADRLQRTRCAVRTWRGCVVVNAGHASPYAVDRGSTASIPRQVGGTKSKRLHSLQSNFVARFPRDFRAVEYLPTAHRARVLCSAQCAVGMVVLWPNAVRDPTHTVGRDEAPPTTRQVGSLAFERSWSIHPNPVARGRRASCLVEYRPTAHGATARGAVRTWRGRVVAQCGACSPLYESVRPYSSC